MESKSPCLEKILKHTKNTIVNGVKPIQTHSKNTTRLTRNDSENIIKRIVPKLVSIFKKSSKAKAAVDVAGRSIRVHWIFITPILLPNTKKLPAWCVHTASNGFKKK